MEVNAQELKSDTCNKSQKVKLILSEKSISIVRENEDYKIELDDITGVGCDYNATSVMVLPIPINIPAGGGITLKLLTENGLHEYLIYTTFKHKTEDKEDLLKITNYISEYTFIRRGNVYLNNLREKKYCRWNDKELHVNPQYTLIAEGSKKIYINKTYYIHDDGENIVFADKKFFGTKIKFGKSEIDYDVIKYILHKYFKVSKDIPKI